MTLTHVDTGPWYPWPPNAIPDRALNVVRDPQHDPDPEPCRRCDRWPGNACEHCEATS